MSAEFSTPTCGKCRWQVKATAASRYTSSPPMTLGLMVEAGGWPGVDIGEQHFNALGAHYCEHPQQPRGLVLTNYSCRNFERPPEVDGQLQIAASQLEIQP